MLRSLSLVPNFDMKSPTANNALSDFDGCWWYCIQSINEKTNIVCLFSSHLKNVQFFLKVFHIIIIQWF